MSGNDGIYSPAAAAAGPIGNSSNGSSEQRQAISPLEVSKAYAKEGLTLVQQKVKFGPLRSPQQFVGLGEAKPFSLPPAADIVARLRQNLPYYSSNYLLMYLVLCAMSIITSPVSLISLGITGGAWLWLLRAASNPETDSIHFGSAFAVKKQIAFAVMGVASIFVGLLLLGTLVGWSLWLTAGVALAHSTTRDATALIEAAEANANKLEGDMGPFLNA